MNKPLTELLKEATKDLLTEESLKVISEAFDAQVDTAVEQKLKESVDAAVQTALESQDAEYATKLEKLLEALDTDHAAKLEKIVARIDENHAAKLKVLAEKYSKEAKVAAAEFKKTLVEKVSKYLDIRLNEAIPVEAIREAVENTRAKRIVKQIREAVALDEDFVTNEIREALVDGKRQIDESAQLAKQLAAQVKLLTEQNQKLHTSLLLEQKTADLPKEKKDYVMKVLANKDEKFITENFNYIVEMFEKEEEEEIEELVETAETVIGTQKIDQPVVEEKAEDDGTDPSMSVYLEGLK